MCRVFADNGYKIEMLEERAGISSPDVKINGKLADLKSTKGAGNIVKYAHKAIKKQQAEIILFEFETLSSKYIEEVEKLKRENIHGYFYVKRENKIRKF